MANPWRISSVTYYNSKVSHLQSRERHGDTTVWEGVVHVFDLTGHPKATRAYARSSPIEGSDKRRLFAVLQLPPVTSPAEAVRAAIVAEAKEAKK